MQCLKCGEERNQIDIQCPKCGVFYAKTGGVTDEKVIEFEQRTAEVKKTEFSPNTRYKISYEDSNGETTDRIIHDVKYFLDEHNHQEYIEAFCELRKEVRHFKIERIIPPIIDVNSGAVLWLNYLKPSTLSTQTNNEQLLTDGQIICPNSSCGYVGLPSKKAKFSNLLCFIAPGIFTKGYNYSCPKCGNKINVLE